MDWLKKSDRFYLQSALLSSPHLIHGFTGKRGGISAGKITGLNLGFRVEDDPNSVMENYRLVAKDLEFPMENTVLSRQTHTDNIRIVTKDDMGKGLVRESDIFDTDGLITKETNIPLIVFSADCVPVLLFDSKTPAIAAIHAGWRGTIQGIAGKAVTMMKEHFSSNPRDILAAIGPSIGPCCFEFGENALDYFSADFCTPKGEDKYFVDIWAMNQKQLLDAGLLPEHIDSSNLCTVCHADKFYSYRTHRENTGRQGAVIMLK